MPTVLRREGYRCYFYSHEPNEPMHIHVDKAEASAKFWLEPVALARNVGFNARELNVLLSLVRHHRIQFVEAWRGYFGETG
ncbi:MAG TPA: DUF4160 domain-containing protein [Vineibacter sp.]|nr:DUF4160 domain-containing protein [Vineibacter sp.]